MLQYTLLSASFKFNTKIYIFLIYKSFFPTNRQYKMIAIFPFIMAERRALLPMLYEIDIIADYLNKIDPYTKKL